MRQLVGPQCNDGATCDGVWLDGQMLVLRGTAVEEVARAPHEAVIRLPVRLVDEALDEAARG